MWTLENPFHTLKHVAKTVPIYIKIKTLKSICSNLKHKQNRFCSNLAHAPLLTGYAPVHVTLGFQLSASRIGSILSLTILHSVLTTDYTVANNFESNDYYTIN
jgi:hypothetical protein